MLRSAAAKQSQESELQKTSGLARRTCLTTWERTVAVAWKPDCRGLRSEWVERKWRQRV